MDLSNVVFIENVDPSKKGKKGSKKKEAKWNLIAPKPGEPWVQRRAGKIYYFCHHCKYWALHQPGKGANCKQQASDPLGDLMHTFGGSSRTFQSATWFQNDNNKSSPNNLAWSRAVLPAGIADNAATNSQFPKQSSLFAGGDAKPSPFGGLGGDKPSPLPNPTNSSWGISKVYNPFGAGFRVAEKHAFGNTVTQPSPFGAQHSLFGNTATKSTKKPFGGCSAVEKQGGKTEPSPFGGFAAASLPSQAFGGSPNRSPFSVSSVATAKTTNTTIKNHSDAAVTYASAFGGCWSDGAKPGFSATPPVESHDQHPLCSVVSSKPIELKPPSFSFQPAKKDTPFSFAPANHTATAQSFSFAPANQTAKAPFSSFDHAKKKAPKDAFFSFAPATAPATNPLFSREEQAAPTVWVAQSSFSTSGRKQQFSFEASRSQDVKSETGLKGILKPTSFASSKPNATKPASSESAFSFGPAPPPAATSLTPSFLPPPSETKEPPKASPPVRPEPQPTASNNAPPSFLFDHYGPVPVTPTPLVSSSETVIAVQMRALEAKRQEILRYLVR